LVAGAGVALLAIGLADRLAFVVTPTGAILVVGGVMVLAATALVERWPAAPSTVERRNLALTGLFMLFALLSALRPYRDDLAASVLTILAVAAFFATEPLPMLRRHRLWVVAPILLASHAVLVLHIDFPKQDVFRLLTYGVDGFFHQGTNPFLPIHDPVSPDVKLLQFGYPPGILFAVAPFRLFLGDVRWAFVAGEALFVVGAAQTVRRNGPLATWQHALVLLPLVLPRTAQAYYDYGNHEWVLLGLAAMALGWPRRWVFSGLALGLGIASKQHFVVFPLLYVLPWLRRRAVFLGLAAAMAIALPFLAWDAGWFRLDVFMLVGVAPDRARLTIYAILRSLGLDIGLRATWILTAIGLAAALGLAWVGRRTLDRALVCCGVGLCVVSLCSNYAAYNYYGYALAFIAWGLALARPGEGKETGGAGGVLGVVGHQGGEDAFLDVGPHQLGGNEADEHQHRDQARQRDGQARGPQDLTQVEGMTNQVVGAAGGQAARLGKDAEVQSQVQQAIDAEPRPDCHEEIGEDQRPAWQLLGLDREEEEQRPQAQEDKAGVHRHCHRDGVMDGLFGWAAHYVDESHQRREPDRHQAVEEKADARELREMGKGGRDLEPEEVELHRGEEGEQGARKQLPEHKKSWSLSLRVGSRNRLQRGLY
jgi:hypothetical protein